MKITKSTLDELLNYNPVTGILTWKARPLSMFKSQRDCNVWNTRYSGGQAGCIASSGHRMVTIGNKLRLSARQLAWIITYGKLPDGIINPIDGDKDNAKLNNLEVITKAESIKPKVKDKPKENDFCKSMMTMRWV